jgi:hypothetical protein
MNTSESHVLKRCYYFRNVSLKQNKARVHVAFWRLVEPFRGGRKRSSSLETKKQGGRIQRGGEYEYQAGYN